MTRRRIAFVATHPVQYYSPWYASLARHHDLTVFYALKATGADQARAGFDIEFEWDTPLLEGYHHEWLNNVAQHPDLSFSGCDTPEIGARLEAGGFDALVVLGWNKKSSVQALLAARRQKLPVFVRGDSILNSPRSAAVKLLKYLPYRMIMPRMAHYLYPGARAREYLEYYGVPARRLHYLPHMVDTARIGSDAAEARGSGEAARLRRQSGAGVADTILLTVGKLIGRKRISMLLQAYRRMLAAEPDLVGRSQLWIVGSGPEQCELEAVAMSYGLPVRFWGFQNQTVLPAFYAAADCQVLASDDDTWGLVVNEGFAAGLPAIVSNLCGCVPNMIFDGETGWQFGTEEELQDCLRLAVLNSRSLDMQDIARVNQAHSFAQGQACFDAALERVLS
ncbi:Glycosyl transferase/GT4 [Candidatus Phaeomarinobacter ectocarpi]|uniref:Glycosyl transferase/GT4 n=1 Tax=Candidatus Phaeomarinibacter ectocarpi TaxID=1458461 RepID=X5MM98_9HYPH|nr:glycosyltransferase family 4 protein [Candidatus Phaeomarinobacter ectocarpi]CDO59066.1 Glycosyl transferase/GT4 [Candidatus Phaeomarinobacter ectocarpi]